MLVIQFPCTWPQHVTKLRVGIVFKDGFWRKKTRQQREDGITHLSTQQLMPGGFKFSTNAGNNVGKVQGNEDTRVSLPYFSSETDQKFAALMHTKECSRRKTPLLLHALQSATGSHPPKVIVSAGGKWSLGWLGVAVTQHHPSRTDKLLQPLALRSFCPAKL